MFKKLLVAYDGSAAAVKAFERSVEMAQCFGAQLAIVVVLRPPEFAEEVETRAVLENARNRFDPEITSLQRRARTLGVDLVPYTCVGHPAEQIIATADRWEADLIVTGHRGQGLFERWLLGSVSRVVIAYARCAVMVVR
jgi:nucleotide-binding universal stress UspA family protein